ncbi:hypothetical protein Gogos_010000 [Gossypium gossypioides]|uniref:Uncharacterized protein n=1 Tax=Gossypium gossypioides TaxID=34282 RepID=A0A7J9BJS4_GOSGO|nr:hypothetical protein [Gossypium gossypioides]
MIPWVDVKLSKLLLLQE